MCDLMLEASRRQWTHNPLVLGSNPSGPTNFTKPIVFICAKAKPRKAASKKGLRHIDQVRDNSFRSSVQ